MCHNHPRRRKLVDLSTKSLFVPGLFVSNAKAFLQNLLTLHHSFLIGTVPTQQQICWILHAYVAYASCLLWFGAGSARLLHSIPAAGQQQSVTPMLKNVYRFWLLHGVDEKYGEPMRISVAQ
jgi:hypothetical protein